MISYCGCCGNKVDIPVRVRNEMADDYWCLPCREHVIPPPGWT